jgi:hypothetical protein
MELWKCMNNPDFKHCKKEHFTLKVCKIHAVYTLKVCTF